MQSSCRYFNNLKGGTNVRALLKQYGSESKHSNHKRHLTVMNKWIKTSSEDRYRHRFTWLLHIIPKQYMKKNWGQILTSNLILIYSYLMQDTIRTVVQFPHVFFAPRDSVRAAQTCPHLPVFVKRSFITQICMKIEIVMQLLKNLYYQISPISVDWKHTEGWVHTIPLCLFWFCKSRKQRTVTARRWNEGHIQHITTEVKKSTKAYGN